MIDQMEREREVLQCYGSRRANSRREEREMKVGVGPQDVRFRIWRFDRRALRYWT